MPCTHGAAAEHVACLNFLPLRLSGNYYDGCPTLKLFGQTPGLPDPFDPGPTVASQVFHGRCVLANRAFRTHSHLLFNHSQGLHQSLALAANYSQNYASHLSPTTTPRHIGGVPHSRREVYLSRRYNTCRRPTAVGTISHPGPSRRSPKLKRSRRDPIFGTCCLTTARFAPFPSTCHSH